jgi:hypothetical protein
MLITAQQTRALAILARALAGEDVYLAGGVGVAAHLEHRGSRDIDLFTSSSDPSTFAERLSQEPEVRVAGRAPGTLFLEVAGVPASIIRYRYPLLSSPVIVEGKPMPVASLADLLCMKLSAVSQRGAARDFWDLHELLTRTKMGLVGALDAFRLKFAQEDIGHVVRSLVYFADADAEPRPMGLTETSWQHIKDDFRRWVSAL